MTTLQRMHRIAAHQERIARLELAEAEQARSTHQRHVEEAGRSVTLALQHPSEDQEDHLHRHGYALRMEMSRRAAERRLFERQREVGVRREHLESTSREKGKLSRMIELREAAERAEADQRDQRRMDETGLLAWWRS
jgi:flagellar export protein FliJ